MDAPSQQPVVIPPARASSGCGCCAGGCMSFVVAAILALVLLVFSAWYFGNKFIRQYTSPETANVAIEMPTDAQFAPADAKFNQLREALRSGQKTTVAFTAAELNALIARHPDFAMRKGKMRISIADSLATVQMSVPLNTVQFGGVKHRWFNGSARFGFIYAQEGFEFDPQWIEANGHRLASKWLNWSAHTFNRSFSNGFEKAVSDDGDNFWKNVKTMTLEGEQLVVITKGS